MGPEKTCSHFIGIVLNGTKKNQQEKILLNASRVRNPSK